MVAALAYMDAEAVGPVIKPLDVSTWEAALPDGRVMVVVRSQAEASAVVRASRAADGLSYETTLPPDLAVTVRSQHEGRALVVLPSRSRPPADDGRGESRRRRMGGNCNFR